MDTRGGVCTRGAGEHSRGLLQRGGVHQRHGLYSRGKGVVYTRARRGMYIRGTPEPKNAFSFLFY